MKFLSLLGLSLLLLASCNTSNQAGKQSGMVHGWKDVAVIEELEVYVDTLNIRQIDGKCYAWVKTSYMTERAIELYVNKIRDSYLVNNSNVDKKMEKWNNFQYNISYRIYDCTNKRYKTLEVTDYTFSGEKIITTKPPKNNENWVDVDMDTMGDYTLYYICDYHSN